MSSTLYSNFFSSQTISLLFCLVQLNQRSTDPKPQDLITKFILNKILTINEVKLQTMTNDAFEAELLSVTNDDSFLEKYREEIQNINSFNDFYGRISEILKNLRSIRTNKLEQSNLIDFFVRRLCIYFQKLDFKEIVGIYEEFQSYVNGIEKKPKQNQFMLTKSIEEVRFNIENYSFKSNSEQINQIIEELEKQDHTYKTSYLKGIVYAQQGSPAQSSHFLRRYFDKNLMNLFPDRVDIGNTNKINHCILGVAFADLQLGHLDQCLQSISEGLRISQNNSDEQSINNCIIYLYHVAEKLGKFHQQILLAAHAITHSLNQSNLTLTLYSCLNCSLFEKRYDYNDSSLSLLKARQVSWKDALHFAKKKLHSHYENSCRNIFHSYRNLLIPSFVHKLAILAQIPSLKNLLINPYYEREELLSLAIYRQFNQENEISTLIQKGKIYLGTRQKILQLKVLQELSKIKSDANPQEIIKICQFQNEVRFASGSLMECLNKTQQLCKYCKKNGFIKKEYAECLIMIAEILLQNSLPYDSLVQTEEVLKLCNQYGLNIQGLSCRIMKAKILITMDLYQQAIEILKEIQEKGLKSMLSQQQIKQFYETKLLLNKNLIVLLKDEDVAVNCLNQNIIELYQLLIKSSLSQNNLEEVFRNLQAMHNFVHKHPVFMNRSAQLQKGMRYCEMVFGVLENWEDEVGEDLTLVQKIMEKVKRICQIK